MNDITLYRKYRPKKFSDVIGQEQIVRALKSSIENNAVAHAYLFCGSRGTGKTSIARILAESIGTSANDMYEIDAASNRGIDDVRLLRDSVATLPFESKFKVYIIDEVHMLTKEAFNALLKTLEEPPAHVVFVLATTEMEKILDTIVSRCQTYVFKKPTQELLKQLVISVAKKEGYSIDLASADLIALFGDGSFRDTLGVLQKAITTSKDNKLTLSEVEKVTGAPKSALINEVVLALNQKEAEKGLRAIRTAVEEGIDMKIFTRMLIQKIRIILLIRSASGFAAVIKDDVSETDYSMLKKIADETVSPINSKTILELLNALDLTGKSYIDELPLELAVIRLTGAEK